MSTMSNEEAASMEKNIASMMKTNVHNGAEIEYLVNKCSSLETQKEELLALVKATAKGALASSERDKYAMNMAMEAIGLLHSMLVSGETHSDKSISIVEKAVQELHFALRFKSEEPKSGATLGAIAGARSYSQPPKGWAGTPEMATEFIKNRKCKEDNCDCISGKSLDFYCGCKCHDVPPKQ